MKLTTTLPAVLAATIAMGALSSCDSENSEDLIYQHHLTPCFAIVSDKTTGNVVGVSTSVGINMDVNWTTAKADLTVAGLTVGAQAYPMFSISKMAWTIDKTNSEWREIKGHANAVSASGAPISINDFELEWNDRTTLATFSKDYDPAVYFEFELDGKYEVVGSRQPFTMGGKTESFPPSSSNGYTSTSTLYIVSLDFGSSLAKIDIYNAVFAQGMPAQDMQFANIPFTYDAEANITLRSDRLIPTIAGVPYENYPISNLSATIDSESHDGTVNFTCSVHGAPFTVAARINSDSYADYLATKD